MRKITYTDEQLKEVCIMYSEALERSLPDLSECVAPFEYSKDFLDKIERLVLRERRRQKIGALSRRVASIILAVLIGAGAWLTVDAEARAAFVSWVREVYEDSFVYRYFGEKPEEGLQEYEITALPEGYELAVADCKEDKHIKIYQGEESKIMLVYHQYFDDRDFIVANINEFSCTWEQIRVNDDVADFYQYHDEKYANELFWINEETRVAFQLSAFMDRDEMVRLAESIKIE